MDNIEVLSDCSESSNNSECLSSNASSLSGLSEYEGEFFELRKLINPESKLKNLKSNKDSTKTIISWYEKEIENLTFQLKNLVKQNEECKKDLFTLEKRKDILYNEKIEKLIKQNNQTENNLLAANNQVQRLINVYSTKDDSKGKAILEKKILQLEKSNHELTNQNYLLSNQVNQCTLQKDEIENEYKNIKSEFNDLKLELEAKVNCVDELKKKITSQHVQLQDYSQKNVNLTHSLELMSNELQYVKKSESWYKQELRQIQNDKSSLNKKNLECEKALASQEEHIEKLKLELSNWKCTCEEIHLTALKEKERILKHIEYVNNHLIQKESENSGQSDASSDIARFTNYYESVINELTNDIAKIKLDFDHQQRSFENVSEENANILTKYLSLQNSLKEKENVIEKLEIDRKYLKEKLSLTMEKQIEQNSKLLELNKICAKLEIEINVKNQEKGIVEESIVNIKEQFKLFKDKYTCLKEELYQRNKELSHLQYEKEELRRANFLQHNKVKKDLDKYVEDIRELKEKILCLEGIKKKLELENMNYSQEINKLNFDNRQKKYLNSYHTHQNNMLDMNVPTKFQEEGSVYVPLDVENVTVDSSNVNICLMDLIKQVFILCQDDNASDSSQNYEFVLSENQSHYIKVLLNKIIKRIDFFENDVSAKNDTIRELKKKMNKIKKYTKLYIEKLDCRCKYLEEKSEGNSKLLTFLQENQKNCNSVEQIQHLQALLQVKTEEAKEKQKRYEKNYRTLLKKVKEHMRGRNTVEKHNAYLQDLQTTLSSECNTLKLQLDLKHSELNELKIRADNYSRLNEKLKLTVLKLKEEVSKPCPNCVNMDVLNKDKLDLEKSFNNSENFKTANLNSVKEKDKAQKENERLMLAISDLNTERIENLAKIDSFRENYQILSDQLLDSQNMLAEEKSTNEHLKIEIEKIENKMSKIGSEKDQLNKQLENSIEQNLYLRREIEHLSSCLQLKSEEVNDLHLRKEKSESRWLEKETNMENLISGLKNQIFLFKADLDRIKNEKFFLQRLCSDLKLALKVHINHNKALREYLNGVKSKGSNKNENSFIITSFPSPAKYDDAYIDKLLQENRSPIQDKPFNDIQECLGTLRNEILYLQKQIVEKGVGT